MKGVSMDNDKFYRRRKLTSRMLCEKYGVVVRTIDRWLATGILPPPLVINNIRYWDEGEIEQRERERMLSPTNRTRRPEVVRPTGVEHA
jgi:predicted DNA-binding transcriptional regulator AlpA